MTCYFMTVIRMVINSSHRNQISKVDIKMVVWPDCSNLCFLMGPTAYINKQTKLSFKTWYSIETYLKLRKIKYLRFSANLRSKINKKFKDSRKISIFEISVVLEIFGFGKTGFSKSSSSMSNHSSYFQKQNLKPR